MDQRAKYRRERSHGVASCEFLAVSCEKKIGWLLAAGYWGNAGNAKDIVARE